MRNLTTSSLIVLCLSLASGSVGGVEPKPEWEKFDKAVTVFGNVDRPGFYTLSDRPIMLAQIITAAAYRQRTAAFVVLIRPDGKAAKRIQIDAGRLKEDGNIPLQANDVIEVTTKAE
jgi:protein involved in polysaccharide export with SLBB domain